jgi:hypothetical protein
MDLFEALQNLYAERVSLMRAISALEALQIPGNTPTDTGRPKRGRRSMNSQEREEVSLRMKNYWAKRRISKMEDQRS